MNPTDPLQQIDLEDRAQRFFDGIFGAGSRILFSWRGESFEQLAAVAAKRDRDAWWKEMRGRVWERPATATTAASSSRSRRGIKRSGSVKRSA